MTGITESFRSELQSLLNRHSIENGSDTPDFLLADYLLRSIQSYNELAKARDKYFGVDMWSEDKLSKNNTK